MVLDNMEKIYASSELMDYLTCGQCFREFPLQMITTFIIHKKLECNDQTEQPDNSTNTDTDLQCSSCPKVFMTAWGLMNHVQSTHDIHLFITKRKYFKETETKTTTKTIINQSEDAFLATPVTATSENRSSVTNHNSIVSSIPPKHQIVKQPPAVSRAVSSEHLPVPVPRITEQVLCYSQPDTDSSTSKSVAPQPSSFLDQRLQSVITSVPGKTSSPCNHFVRDNAVSETTSEEVKETVKNTDMVEFPPVESHPSDQESQLKSSLVYKTNVISSPEQQPSKISTSETLPYPSSEDMKSTIDTICTEPAVKKTEPDLSSCCNNQTCGVTVIPVTHEKLKECCNAVVPKKRKRHFETKHIPGGWRFGKRRGSITNFESKSTSAGTIYIDVQPDTGEVASSVIENPTRSSNSLTSDRSSSMQECDSKTGVISHSVILKPGAVFSIPFPYAISSSNSAPKHFQLNSSGTLSSPSHPEMIHQREGKGTQIIMRHSELNSTVPPVASVQSAIHSTTASPSKVGISSPLASSDSGQDNMNPASQMLSEGYGQSIVISSESLSDPFHDSDLKGFLRKRRYPTSRPYKCEQCDNAFNQRIHLKKHMSKHTGIKPYKCQQCDYSTVERSHLKVHIRIHTGEKPFKCTYCEYATAQNSTLKIHLKRHHGGKIFECQQCDRKFAQIDLLQNHEVEHQQPLDEADQSADIQNSQKIVMNPAEVIQIAQESQISSSSSSSSLPPIESIVVSQNSSKLSYNVEDSHISQSTQQVKDKPGSLNDVLHEVKMCDSSGSFESQSTSVDLNEDK